MLKLLLKEISKELTEHKLNDIDENALHGDEEERENAPSARAAVPPRVQACIKLLSVTFGKAYQAFKDAPGLVKLNSALEDLDMKERFNLTEAPRSSGFSWASQR